ncbi:MAG: transposase [Thermodesulfobacteriota bacterium]
MSEPLSTKILEPHIPKHVVCPYCGLRQPFVKETQYWRSVKAPHLKYPLVLKIRMVCAKCKNPDCHHKSFTLPIPGVSRYQRATQSLITEAVAGVVQDNSTLRRIAKRLTRSFNTTGSKSTLDRWKKLLASNYDFPKILSQLQFSGALSIDEYMPRRGGRYEQIAGDAIQPRILYIEPVPWFYGRGVTEKFLQKLQNWGIHPYCVIFDLWTTFPKVIRKVWPHASLQYDHFHVMQRLWYYLKNALIQFRKSLKGERWTLHREELWEMRWGLLKHMDRWSEKDHLLIPEMIEIYKGTPVEKVLLFKEELWNIFDLSKTKAEAIAKRNTLAQEHWWQDSWHLKKCMDFLMSPKFNLMITYLEDPQVPRSGHSETFINIWRQMETVRRGFKTHQGRLNHLKLFQITNYLKQPL